MSSYTDSSSVPCIPPDSAGSSVSSSLQLEYEELLRYAVVTPKVTMPQLAEKKAQEKAASLSSGNTTLDSYTRDGSSGQKDVMNLPTTLQSETRVSSTIQQTTEERPTDTNTSGNSSSQNSPLSSSRDVSTLDGSSCMPESPSIDGDLVRMETQLDMWCLDMKRNILADYTQSKMALLDKHRQALRNEKQRHAAEMNKQQNEIESLKELLFTYEKTMAHKDHIITNMTIAIQKQKERFDLLRRFSVWKLKHVEERKESFGANLARKHRDHVLKRQLMSAWRSVVETKWKQKVEKACQSKAQDVCIKLTDEYEAKLLQANKALEEARLEVGRLHAERELYEETMKKAFMRGVCALNLEAMHMFREPNDENEEVKSNNEPGMTRDSDPTSEMVPRTNPPKPSAVSCDRRHGNTAAPTTRTINVKATARPEFRAGGKNTTTGLPGSNSVSSVLVQRHNKTSDPKTVRYPQPAAGQKHPAASGAKVKSGGVKTSHAPPVKVVH